MRNDLLAMDASNALAWHPQLTAQLLMLAARFQSMLLDNHVQRPVHSSGAAHHARKVIMLAAMRMQSAGHDGAIRTARGFGLLPDHSSPRCSEGVSDAFTQAASETDWRQTEAASTANCAAAQALASPLGLAQMSEAQTITAKSVCSLPWIIRIRSPAWLACTNATQAQRATCTRCALCASVSHTMQQTLVINGPGTLSGCQADCCGQRSLSPPGCAP